MSASALGGQKRMSDCLELEFQVVLSLLAWMLGTELLIPPEEHQVLLASELSLQPSELSYF